MAGTSGKPSSRTHARIRSIGAVLLVAAVAAVAAPPPSGAAVRPPTAGRAEPDWLERLNETRRWGGLPEVAEDPDFSADAYASSSFLADTGQFTHYPVGAPPDAARGAATSNLLAASLIMSHREIIDEWTNSLGHGMWNLHPALRRVGFGEAVRDMSDPHAPLIASLTVLGEDIDYEPDRTRTFPADGVSDFDLTPSFGYYNECGWSSGGGPVLRIMGTSESHIPDPEASVALRVNGKLTETCLLTLTDYAPLGTTDTLAIVPRFPFPLGALVEVDAVWHEPVSWSFRTSPVGGTVTVRRLAGADRFATAVAISRDAYPAAGSAEAAVLVRADSYADALAGTPLAVAKAGPLLLTSPSELSSTTADELDRVLRPGGTVFVLGGTAAVSVAVEQQLVAAGHLVVRYAGADRFATAVAVAERGLGSPDQVFVATGRDFQDPLTAGAAAGAVGAAVLLTDGSVMPASTSAYLDRVRPTAAYLGDAAVAAKGGRPGVEVSGRPDSVALDVAELYFPGWTSVGVVGNGGFADALTGGVHAAARGAPLLWSDVTVPPWWSVSSLAYRRGHADSVFAYGGTGALADVAVSSVAASLKRLFSGHFS